MPKVTIKSLPPQVNSGITVEDNAVKQISPSFQQIGGKPHSQGGTDVQYAGQTVEMQNSEPISLDQNNNLVAFGKLRIPSTNMTFETGAKKLAEVENKNVKQADKAVNLINSSDPYDKFESLAFNSGVVLGNAAQIKQKEVLQTKQALGELQQDILDRANQLGIAPEKLQKMKNGGTMKVKIKSVPQYKNGGVIPMYQAGGTINDPQQDYLNWLYNSPDVYGNTGFIPAEQRAIVAPNAQGSLAQRNNNPGNLRFAGQKGATKGDGGFAKFPSYDLGYAALVNDIKAKQSGKTKTKLGPNSNLLDLMNVYSPAADSNDPQRLATTLAQGLGVGVDTKIGDLDTNKLADLIARNEDAAYASQQDNQGTNFTPQSQVQPEPLVRPDVRPIYNDTLPDQTVNYNTRNLIPGYQDQLNPTQASILADQLDYRQPNIPSSIPQAQPIAQKPIRSNFNYLSILPEVAAILDRPDYVQGQQYTPTLYEPYRVSYQDQINNNTANFNQVAQLANNNPGALSTLVGQLYQQNQGVLANEFRQNQQVQNQVANQNTELMNQAQLQNLQLADQQYTRQEQARANTEAARQAALTSISQKVQQNQLLNNQLAQQQYQNRLVENFSGYRDIGNGQLAYQGPNAQFNYGNIPQANPIQNMTPEQLKVYRQQLAAQQQQQKLQQTQAKTNQITQFLKGL